MDAKAVQLLATAAACLDAVLKRYPDLDSSDWRTMVNAQFVIETQIRREVSDT